nr:immunoglobulin light chain junction region [Macaca mulatta]MOV82947.1 immunoglobulin light chain junction region [Macaca mulatta]MOV85196.1 immunoglobulin light chain junction region [Macaca mulatta]
CQQYNDVLFTF